MAPLSAEEKAPLRQLVGAVRALGQAVERRLEERKRLVRGLIREVVLLTDEQPRGQGGLTTLRLGWCSGAWSELPVRRPSGADLAATPQRVLQHIRDLAPGHSDQHVAGLLNAEGLRTKRGLSRRPTVPTMPQLRVRVPYELE